MEVARSAAVTEGGERAGGRPAPSAHGVRIRDWPEGDRPRERLLRLGAAALGDAELLGILVGSGRGGQTAVDLGRRLAALGGRDGAAGLCRLTADDLAAVSGIGPAKAAVLLAALELGRRVATAAPGLPAKCLGPADVAPALMAEMAPLDREQFRVLLLDAKHRLMGSEVIALGGLDHVPVDPREVYKPAVRRSAAAVIVAHNHPSGDPEPSGADLDLTVRLADAGRVLGISLLDHLVIGRGAYVSIASRGGLVAFG